MIRPILACRNPYQTADRLLSGGWELDFSNPPDSGDPLVGVSLLGNALLLGITNGYVPENKLADIGCGVAFYLTVPQEQLEPIYQNHRCFNPSELKRQPWGDLAFEFQLEGFQFMIAGYRDKK